MKVFVDTSAFYALASSTDQAHAAAVTIHEHLKRVSAQLITNNYVLLESISLLQRRHGLAEATRFGDAVGSRLSVVWMNELQHGRVWEYWKRQSKRGLSLVDCSCFVVMHELGVREAFTFDAQFRAAGFVPVIAPDGLVAERRATYRVKRT